MNFNNYLNRTITSHSPVISRFLNMSSIYFTPIPILGERGGNFKNMEQLFKNKSSQNSGYSSHGGKEKDPKTF